MVHPSSHKTLNDINGAVFIFGKMWILLACLFRPGSWSAVMWEDSIVLPSGSISVISVEIITGNILVVDCFAMCIFAPESVIED